MLVLSTAPAWAGAPSILLPEPFAVELAKDDAGVGPDDPAMRALVDRVTADGHKVTAVFPRHRLGPGLWPVILTAWDGEAADFPLARREAYLFVLPHGMTPVGSTGKTDATAGNNATHIVRDKNGFVHMVWTDSWRPGARPGGLYRRAKVWPDGSARFETDNLDLAPNPGNWTSIPSLCADGDTIHFAWQDNGSVWYRALTFDAAGWHWSDPVDTKAPGPGRDTGPSIAAGAGSVHILTPAGVYTASRDGGRTWTTEPAVFGPDARVKTASLTLDASGRPLAAASVVIASPPLTEDRGHGGYWTMRIERRSAAGVWEEVRGPLADHPEWAAPAHADEDVLADWVRVAEDRAGGMHATWHGTAVSRIFANDAAYYAFRPKDGGWRELVSLHAPNRRRGDGWSYAPGLALDGVVALPLVFHNRLSGGQDRGFDAELGLYRDGRMLAPPLPVTHFARDAILAGEPASALSAWFPGPAPTPSRDANGRVWLDVLMTLVPAGVTAPGLTVWQRLDITRWLAAADQ